MPITTKTILTRRDEIVELEDTKSMAHKMIDRFFANTTYGKPQALAVGCILDASKKGELQISLKLVESNLPR